MDGPANLGAAGHSLEKGNILGVITSGFTYLKIGSDYQEIIKGAIIAFAVVIDQYRRNRKTRV